MWRLQFLFLLKIAFTIQILFCSSNTIHMVSNATWKDFTSFSYFVTYFHKLLEEWNNSKTRKRSTVFVNTGQIYCEVNSLSLPNKYARDAM